MTVADLTINVKVIMDEYTPDGVTLPFDDYITPMLEDAAREIAEKAPLHLLTSTAIPLTEPPDDPPSVPPVDPASLVVYLNDKSYIPVPADYIRLYEIKYPLWKKSVRKAYPVESSAYRSQENESLTPGYGRPFVGIVQTSLSGGAAARYFECAKVIDPSPGIITPVALYVKSPTPTEIRDSLIDAYCWLTASKLFGIMRVGDLAKFANDQFVNRLTFLGNS